MTYDLQSWLGYNLQPRFSKHWGSWIDAELHTKDHYFNGFTQSVFRIGGTYYTNKGTKFTLGYGYTSYFPGDKHPQLTVPEHFVWQQFQWYLHPGRSKIMQWIRFEEKFKRDLQPDATLASSSSTNYKLRYNVFCTFPLNKKGLIAHSWAFVLGNELYLYYNPEGSNHIFDQHRLFLGLSYAVNAHDNLVMGVNNNLIENSAGDQFNYQNILKVTFFENIRL